MNRGASRTGADLIVLGAGIIGCACAYYAARRGLSVLVVESESVAAGASGACDGHLAIQTKAPGLPAALSVQSMELYRALPASLHSQAEFRACGSLLVAEDDSEARALEALMPSREATGVSVRMLRGSQARQLEPALAGHIVAATHCATDMQANPWRITRWFAQAAADLGAHFLTGSPARLGQDSPGVVTLSAGDKALRASRIVVAAGPWTPAVCPFLPADCVIPRRGEILVTERLPRRINGLILSATYLARKLGDGAGTARATLALEQTLPGNLLIGGTREFAGFQRDVTPEGTAALAQCAARIVPSLARAHVIRSFAGLRPYTPDGLPLVGPLSQAPRIAVACGHEGDGITMAAVTGKMIADWAAGQALPPAELSPDRFAPSTSQPQESERA